MFMICAPVLIDVMMKSYACNYNHPMIWCNRMWLQLLTLCFATSQYEMSCDVCFGANQCYDATSKCLWLQLLNLRFAASQYDNMQSYACDCNCWLCALPQVNMKVNDAILWLWSNLWKIVKLTRLSMILATYYGINLPKFASNNDRLSAVHLRKLYALLHLPSLVWKQECNSC